jgi:hypothetical protein
MALRCNVAGAIPWYGAYNKWYSVPSNSSAILGGLRGIEGDGIGFDHTYDKSRPRSEKTATQDEHDAGIVE